MFARFSPHAQAVVHLAEQECRNASHYYLGTEHLLLAMVIAPPDDVLEHFASIGAQPWEIKARLRSAMDPPSEHPWEGVILTPRVRRIFDALSARQPADASIEPVDLLRAMIADGGGVAARVLATWTAPSAAPR
ncbi:MAG TPA: Clp protease N-terminal domain-containing protein [Candidatus Binatus sp.]|nr:Clp protease N-terminal domain-containing protein [Candidatus Binatus sp.]